MGQSLIQIAQTLKDADKKLQLVYAFNGSGKTRLSREFKQLIAPKELEAVQEEDSDIKILYYNAFTEDLFFWDNDLDADSDRKLIIQPNSFTDWVLREQGQDRNIVANFQQLTNDKLTPQFNENFTEIRFSFERGNEDDTEFVKISKGEESCFVWSVFFSLMEQVVSVLNIAEKENRETDQYDKLEYIFIDDPVSSLDDTHLIELAVNISELIKSSTSDLKFIITTHNPLFYNVIFNEFNRVKKTKKWLLEKLNDGTFALNEIQSDSPFSYHLFLLAELEKATQPTGEIKKFHFNFLRNILEKTSTFLGYKNWEELLPQESREAYYRRIINLSSHSKHNGEEIAIVEENDKRVLGFLVSEVKTKYGFKSTINSSTTEQNGAV
ncbi:MAG: AAA family ATPase [Bacteroidetes bacterium]|uniref:AAA family ATPase n=1 Tax=Phnomibacter sp. TaxID=2836217 RepID=UPI002FDDC626|nr:AAA family ATPase [Bacteroidota bacterium]